MYSEWKPGNKGGESETIIGNWMNARGNRHEMVIATKVSKLSTRPGLSDSNIKAALDDSLRRLQTDHIDVYYAHEDDATVALEVTLSAFGDVIAAGKVHVIAASNYSGDRLREAATVSKANNLPSYIGVQNQYNVMDRQPFESDVAPVVQELGITSIPYYGLARGFLTGKYRPGVVVESVRAGGVAGYQTDRGWKVLETIDSVAKDLNTTLSAVALAWLRAHGSIPIASARIAAQAKEILPLIELNSAHIAAIDSASAL
jgi:aryl-alcohol dehydrogenase-like predicted oxidoreductase